MYYLFYFNAELNVGEKSVKKVKVQNMSEIFLSPTICEKFSKSNRRRGISSAVPVRVDETAPQSKTRQQFGVRACGGSSSTEEPVREQ